MKWNHSYLLRVQVCTIVVAGMLLLGNTSSVLAGAATLKNGTRIEGTPVAIQSLVTKLKSNNNSDLTAYSILYIDTGMKRYFVSGRQVQNIDRSAALSKYDQFTITQPKGRRVSTISSLGPFLKVTEFDEFGRRTVTVRTPKGPKPIVQGITIIDPRYLTVVGINNVWEHGIATTSMPPKNLDLILRKVTDKDKSDDRMAIARFYYQAGLYLQAEKELISIKKDFPELKNQVEQIDLKLREQQANQLIQELHRRSRAGQHSLAYSAAKMFPKERMSAGVLRQVRELKKKYVDDFESIKQAKTLLGELQSQLKEKNLQQAIKPLRSEVTAGLNFESLSRLQSFLNLSTDDKLGADEKLALAYSGWVLGSDKAITDLDKAIHLWQARFLMTDYLQTKFSQKQDDILDKLDGLEGIDADTVAKLIPFLPPTIETPNIQPGTAKEITIPKTAIREEIKYHVLLPPEYTPYHSYPMIVALRPIERSCQSELRGWGGTKEKPLQSQRHGYIVIAPEYLSKKQTKYDYSAAEHERILAAILDAKRRFVVNADRIYLSGHGIGGDAACDFGMSHPQLFAGIIPICGLLQHYPKYYWQNVKHVPWYFVGGELDRNALAQNATIITRMMRKGYDVAYCEYIGRGYESYYAEIHKLFDWMDLQKRSKDPKKVVASSLRPCDNRFYWVDIEGFPRATLQSDVLANDRKSRISPLKIEAGVTPGNSINLRSGATTSTTMWLNRSLVDFDKRLTVRHRGKILFKGFAEADTKTIMEDYQHRADRQKIYTFKVSTK